MILSVIIKQTRRDEHMVAFDILENNEQVGNLHFQSKVDGFECAIYGMYKETSFNMQNGTHEKFVMSRKCNPYAVTFKEGRVGEIYREEVKKGLFNLHKEKVYKMNKGGYSYISNHYGLGEDGHKFLVYKESEVISYISKDAVVTDNKHEFEIVTKEKFEIIPSIILCIYIYADTFFKKNDISTETVKCVATTKDKEMIDKYEKDLQKLKKEIVTE